MLLTESSIEVLGNSLRINNEACLYLFLYIHDGSNIIIGKCKVSHLRIQEFSLCCRIVFCKDQCIDSHSLVEDLGLAYGILTRCGVDDKNLLVVLRLDPVADDLVDLLKLPYQVLLVVHSSCCVAENKIVSLGLCA